jgi:hypothetical protein
LDRAADRRRARTSLRRKFPSVLVGACIVLVFFANTINVGADLGAVAAGGSMLTGSHTC